jgi:hypothetical protein
LQTKYDNLDVDCHRFHVANFDLQARIKKLEEALLARSYSVLSAFEIARNAPAKESREYMKQYNIEDLREIDPLLQGEDGRIAVPEQLTSSLTGKTESVRMRYFVEKEAEG